MPTVSEFYDDLRRTLARGSSLEQSLPTWSRQALRHLERNHSFRYMKGTYFVLPLPNSTEFTLSIPRLKAVTTFGYMGSDGGVIPLNKISSESFGAFGTTRPVAFATEGTTIKFEGTLSEAHPLALKVVAYSEWPEEKSATHPLLDLADDLLKYQVLVQHAPALRKQGDMPGWVALRDEALRSALSADDEGERTGRAVMGYRGGTGQLFPRGSEALATISGISQIPGISGVAGLFYAGGA